jgi:hypothetical protein
MLHSRAAITLGVLGVVSGLLTNFISWDLLSIGGTSLLPGVLFALVVVYGVYAWVAKNVAQLVIVFVLTVLAWVAAWNTAILIFEFLDRPNPGRPSISTLVLTGLIAGFVGALITTIAVSVPSKAFREIRNWGRVLLFGAIAGLLVVLSDSGLDEKIAMLPLFVVWQAGVAALIGYGFDSDN